MKYIFLIIALLYTEDATTERQELKIGDGLPEFIGAPCTLKSDYVDGKCVLFEVLSKPRIRKNGKRKQISIKKAGRAKAK